MQRFKVLTGRNNTILRSKAQRIEHITPAIRQLAERMLQTMKEVQGIGLAAPQIGKSIELFVVDELAFQKERGPNGPGKHTRGLSKWEFKKISEPDVSKGFVFINPSIATYPKGQDEMREGCLSLPRWDGIVARSKRITIKAQDIEGRVFTLQAKGLLAKVLQHEYDHLQGVLICDKWREPRKYQKPKTKDQNHKAKMKNIVFFGSSPYSQIVLDKLKDTPYEPEKVMGKIGNWKLEIGNYKLGIVAAYGAIISPEIIKKFRYGILNIHPSLLPKYRGPSPVQAMILSGEMVTGVTIIKLSEKVDAGDIIAQAEFVIDKKYTSSQLHRILFTLGASVLLKILPLWMGGKIVSRKQNENEATYTKLIKKEDGLIDWSEQAFIIERKIRAYEPWPTAYTFFEHRGRTIRVQILEADIVGHALPQTVYGNVEKKNSQLIIQCAKGSLLVKKLKPEGKREMTGEEFLRGYHPSTLTMKNS